MKVEGIYTPVITPYREDGAIDFDALAAMVDYLDGAGVHGIINGGSTGEYYAQLTDERREVASFVKDAIDDRVPLIVGTVAIRSSTARSGTWARTARPRRG